MLQRDFRQWRSQSFWCVLWSAKSNNGVTGSRKGSELMWTRLNDVNDFTVNTRNGVKAHCILEAEGLPEPLSLGITTNGIRCAGCWTILKCRQFLRFFSLHLLCARSKVSQTHARCVESSTVESSEFLWARNCGCLMSVKTANLVRLKRFLPQMRAAGLTNINLSAAPTPDKTRNPIWIWESSIFYHVYCSVTWLFFRVNVCKLCGNVVSAEVRLWANLSLWDLGGNGWVTPAASLWLMVLQRFGHPGTCKVPLLGRTAFGMACWVTESEKKKGRRRIFEFHEESVFARTRYIAAICILIVYDYSVIRVHYSAVLLQKLPASAETGNHQKLCGCKIQPWNTW